MLTEVVGMALALGAILAADVPLMADDLDRLALAVRVGQRTRRVVRQNLVLLFDILAALIPGALVGLIGFPLTVLAHGLSELAMILNGTRMARA